MESRSKDVIIDETKLIASIQELRHSHISEDFGEERAPASQEVRERIEEELERERLKRKEKEFEQQMQNSELEKKLREDSTFGDTAGDGKKVAGGVGEQESTIFSKGRRGRPPGSKNKPKSVIKKEKEERTREQAKKG